jgi:mannose-6-phosphate isomerase
MGFPLLIKLIDAREKLSVQVHPDDDTAKKFGGEAKTEMWYVLAAKPGAALYCGLKPGIDRKQFEQAIQAHQVGELLNRLPVREGDTIFVPGGRVHAIDAGCLIFEVQQNSNTTYRVYDWGRVGTDGKPRPLHIQEALRVINWSDFTSPRAQPTAVAHGCSKIARLLSTPYFRIERINLVDPCDCKSDGGSFNAFFIIDGKLQIGGANGTELLTPGSTCLLPAAITECPLDPLDGPATFLRVTLP